MSVHKVSEQAQHTIQQSKAASLKLAPVLSGELFEDNKTDIGGLALQLLLELDLTTSGEPEVTKLDHISECDGLRAKLLKLFEQQNLIEFEGAEAKITASGRRSFHEILSSQSYGPQVPANIGGLPSGADATNLLLAIMRNHFSESDCYLKAHS